MLLSDCLHQDVRELLVFATADTMPLVENYFELSCARSQEVILGLLFGESETDVKWGLGDGHGHLCEKDGVGRGRDAEIKRKEGPVDTDMDCDGLQSPSPMISRYTNEAGN